MYWNKRFKGSFLYNLVYTCSVYLVWPGSVLGDVEPSRAYRYKAELVPGDQYVMFWDHDNETITVELHVKTTGYIGWGLSPNGGMKDSDITIGWVKDGKPYLYDFYAYQQAAMPQMDTKQDYTLLSGNETGTTTVLQFKRELDTCDATEDRKLTLDTTRVIFSWSDVDPSSPQGIPYHGSTRRGTKSLALTTADIPPPTDLPEDVQTEDFLMFNTTVPSSSTTYWCQGFRNPYTEKVQAIRVDPVIQPGNEGLVHHMLLYGCPVEIDNSLHGAGYDCLAPNAIGMNMSSCSQTLFAWAIGGSNLYFPAHVGLVLEPSMPRFFLLEMHYDNPTRASGVQDASGLRIWTTKTFRKNEAGTLSLGMNDFEPFVIPPQLSQFRTLGYCNPECITMALQAKNLNSFKVFGFVLHTHLIGRAIRVRHFRNNVELPLLAADESYDFNFQEFRFLKKEVSILPGDRLITECDYDSTRRRNVSFSGPATVDEMCQAFLLYYPRIPLTDCTSHPLDSALFRTFNIPSRLFVGSDGYKTHYGAPGSAYEDQLAPQLALTFDWVQDKSRTYEELIQFGQTVLYCGNGPTIYDEGRFVIYNPQRVDKWMPSTSPSPKCTVVTDSASHFQHGYFHRIIPIIVLALHCYFYVLP